MDIYTSYLVRQHLWRVMVVAVLVIAVIVPIHVASSIGWTWEQALEQGRSAIWDVLRYVAYRATDVLSQVFPISVILGLLWSETAHSLSGRRLMALVAGRSYGSEIRALLVIAASSVVVQFVLDNVARPFSVMTMIEQRVGNYDSYMSSAELRNGIWLTTGEIVLQARSIDRETSTFEGVTLYRFNGANQIEQIVSSAKLRPVANHGVPLWHMESGYRVAISAPSAGPGSRLERKTTQFDAETIELPIDPFWVQYIGIPAIYVHVVDLARLALSTAIPLHQPDYAASLQTRLAKAFTPGLLALVAAIVFLLVSRRRHVALGAGIALLVTYVGIAAVNAIGALGQSAWMAGAAGAWFAPGFLLLLATGALWGLWRTARMPALAFETPDAVGREGPATYAVQASARHSS